MKISQRFIFIITSMFVFYETASTQVQSEQYTYQTKIKKIENHIYGANSLGIDYQLDSVEVEFQAIQNSDGSLSPISNNGASVSITDIISNQHLDTLPKPKTLFKTEKQYAISNHLGNVLTTVNDLKLKDGLVDEYIASVESANDYYPFGMGMFGKNSSFNYRFGFNSHEKLEEVKANGNHSTAKFGEYDTRLGRRWNQDPKPNVSLSNYSIFQNNPIVLADIALDTPTTRESFYLAEDSYFDKTSEKVKNMDYERTILPIKGFVYNDSKSGYDASIYSRSINGKVEYVLATRGTEASLGDIKNDALQLVGESEQYEISVKNAKLLRSFLGKNTDLTFVGHSLGGGESAANAIATNGYAITFNAAGLSAGTRKKLGLPYIPFISSYKIDAYIVEGEILDYIQSAVGLRADGNKRIINVDPNGPYQEVYMKIIPFWGLRLISPKIRLDRVGRHTTKAIEDALLYEKIE